MEGVWNAITSAAAAAFNSVKSVASGAIEGVKNTISTVRDTVGSVFDSVKTKISSVFDSVKTKVSTVFENVKTTVKNAIDKIRSFFNFSWSLPKIKLPHFSITGSFSLNPPSIPKFSVEWYKRGGIMTRPTVFGVNGASAMIGGEAGAEAILPLNEFWNRLRDYLARQSQPAAVTNNIYVTVDGGGADDETLANRIAARIVQAIENM